MARRGSKIGYQGYRGRGGGSLVLKVIVALLATTLAAGLIFVVFLGDYMEYTDNGVRFHPPWSTPEDKSSPLPSQALVVVPNPLVTDSLNTPQPTPVSPIGAVEVTPQQLRDGSAKDAVALAEGTALVVEMKAATGALAWQSQNELALTLGVNSQDNAVAQAVQALAQEDELYLIARIQGFRDRSLAEHNLGTLMTRGGIFGMMLRGYAGLTLPIRRLQTTSQPCVWSWLTWALMRSCWKVAAIPIWAKWKCWPGTTTVLKTSPHR